MTSFPLLFVILLHVTVIVEEFLAFVKRVVAIYFESSV